MFTYVDVNVNEAPDSDEPSLNTSPFFLMLNGWDSLWSYFCRICYATKTSQRERERERECGIKTFPGNKNSQKYFYTEKYVFNWYYGKLSREKMSPDKLSPFWMRKNVAQKIVATANCRPPLGAYLWLLYLT
jgi:hypothetical protein